MSITTDNAIITESITQKNDAQGIIMATSFRLEDKV